MWCKRCKTHVWITKDWVDKRVEGPMTANRMESLKWLIDGEQRDRAIIRRLPKTLPIEPKYCTECGAQITHTQECGPDDPYVCIVSDILQCPNCGDIRFYADVARKGG